MENKLPEGWEWKNLGDLTERFVSGGTPPTKNESYWNGTIPWTTSAQINSRFIDFSEKCITDDAVKNSATNIVPKNNVLVATRVGIGKSAVNLIDLAISQDLTGVLLNKSLILPTYLVLYLHSPKLKQNFELSARGSTIRGLTRSDVENIQVPLPPLETQQKIVSILEKAEETKKLRKQADELTQRLLHSVFLEIFGDPVKNPKGWDVRKLGEIITDSMNGLYLPKEKYTFYDGIKMVHMSDAFYGIVELGGLKRVLATEKEIDKYRLTKSDLLIARRSLNFEGAAKACRIPEINEPLIFESSLIKISTNSKLATTIYLYYYLNNELVRKKYIYKHISKSTISGINQSNLRSISVILPPIEIQNKFSHFVEQAESTILTQQQSFLKINNLFDALVQKAFAGELVL